MAERLVYNRVPIAIKNLRPEIGVGEKFPQTSLPVVVDRPLVGVNSVGINQEREQRWRKESEILERIKAGDKNSFGQFYEMYRNDILRFISTRVNDNDDPEGLTQEVFVRAFQKIEGFVHNNSVRTWLYRIAHNLVIDRYRKITRHPNADSLSFEDETNEDSYTEFVPDHSEEIVDKIFVGEFFERLLESLTPLQREVLDLRIQGIPYEEIAAIKGKTIGSCKEVIQSGRGKARKIMKEMDPK